tara:strand:- start:5503 stop:5838 length:336 start_codon:yes stop_codon:yes gene_type:complete
MKIDRKLRLQSQLLKNCQEKRKKNTLIMKKLRVGDLVRYKGWGKTGASGPLGIVVDETAVDDDYHHRIRVTWSGTELPIQARVLSVNGSWTTRWVKPGHFQPVGGDDEEHR